MRAYAMRRAMEPRNEMQAFLRDAVNLKAQALMGSRLDAARWARVEAQASRFGYDAGRLASDDLPAAKRAELAAMQKRLAAALEGEAGSLSRNRRAVAVAKDVHAFLARNSPEFAGLRVRYKGTWEVSANIKGYSGKAFVDGTARLSERGDVKGAWDRERVRYIESNTAAMRDRTVSTMMRDAARGNVGVVDYSSRQAVEEQLRLRSEEMARERARMERRASERAMEEDRSWKGELKRARERYTARESQRQEAGGLHVPCGVLLPRSAGPRSADGAHPLGLPGARGLRPLGVRGGGFQPRRFPRRAYERPQELRGYGRAHRRLAGDATQDRRPRSLDLLRQGDTRSGSAACGARVRREAGPGVGRGEGLRAVEVRPFGGHASTKASPDFGELPAGIESMLERYLRSRHAQEIAGGQGQRQRGMDARWSEGHDGKKAPERGLK